MENQQTEPKREGNYKGRERLRMATKGRDLRSAAYIVRTDAWQGGKLDQQRYEDYLEIWDWLNVRAKKDGLDLEKMPCTSGGLRMSVEYMRRVLVDEMMDFEVKKFMVFCGVKLDDYLKWYEGDLAKYVFRTEQLWENDRIKSQVHLVRKELLKGIKDGDNKKIDMWLKMTGRAKGDDKEEEDFNQPMVNKYLDAQGNEV